jgi:hypothetical protein
LGEYRVAISDTDTEKILDYIPKTPVVKKPSIPAKYADPAQSGLEATVKSGSNSFPFDLK